ncbi:unnamed protein product [Sphagnum troendelagicum]|uniref:Uncharacterized protein n=1 Tax=Sphagnum troendelagicum TaxID=128251 RepID=A0ABP0U5S0_9BRYO
MQGGECSKEIDPGDTELGRSPTERHDSGNGATKAIENMPQDPSRPEMANEINMSSGESCDERKKMMMQPGSEGVAQECDNLSILGDQPASYTETPVSTLFQGLTVEVWNLHIDDVLDVEEVEVLCENLASHPILATLKVLNGSGGTSGDGGDKGTEILCNMLKNNRTIKTLLLGGEPVKEIGLASLGAMLSVNSTLETLHLAAGHGTSETGVELLPAPLTGHDGNPPLNKSLKTLMLSSWEIGQRGARAAAQMLRTNDSLTHMGFRVQKFSGPSDVCTILESLETNETLHTLDLSECDVGGDVVLAKMMDLLRANPWLKEIRLAHTPLERDGHAVQVKAQLEMDSRDYMAVVKGMPRVQPKFARVFLCGDGYSGKQLTQFFNKYLFSHTLEAH